MIHEKKTYGFSNFGFSTILLCFVMICVVVFSALSLVTANSDYKLTKKVADKTTAYYEAETQAYENIYAIEQILIAQYKANSDKEVYYSSLDDLLSSYGKFEKRSSNYYLTFSEGILEEGHLTVTILLNYPIEPEDTFYQIMEWKSDYEQQLPEEENLNLFQ